MYWQRKFEGAPTDWLVAVLVILSSFVKRKAAKAAKERSANVPAAVVDSHDCRIPGGKNAVFD